MAERVVDHYTDGTTSDTLLKGCSFESAITPHLHIGGSPFIGVGSREDLAETRRALDGALKDAARMRTLVDVWKHHAEDAAAVIDGYARTLNGARFDVDQLREQVEQLQSAMVYWQGCAREWHREAIVRATDVRALEASLGNERHLAREHASKMGRQLYALHKRNEALHKRTVKERVKTALRFVGILP